MAFSSNKLLASSDLSTVFKLDGSESDSVRKTDRKTDRQSRYGPRQTERDRGGSHFKTDIIRVLHAKRFVSLEQ